MGILHDTCQRRVAVGAVRFGAERMKRFDLPMLAGVCGRCEKHQNGKREKRSKDGHRHPVRTLYQYDRYCARGQSRCLKSSNKIQMKKMRMYTPVSFKVLFGRMPNDRMPRVEFVNHSSALACPRKVTASGDLVDWAILLRGRRTQIATPNS
ncbi:MAG: hypothetical protein WDM89_21020 [Rhizomicrobium sp.]